MTIALRMALGSGCLKTPIQLGTSIENQQQVFYDPHAGVPPYPLWGSTPSESGGMLTMFSQFMF